MKKEKNNFNNAGKAEGYWEESFMDIQRKVHYKNGLMDGDYKAFNIQSKILLTAGQFKLGSKINVWRHFYSDGKLRNEILYIS